MTIRTPGQHDPYWYESTLGQLYLVKLLDPDSNVLGVTLQATKGQGLDDLHVLCADAPHKYIQIKHTRTNDTFSFTDMVTPQGNSLLRKMATAWIQLRARDVPCQVQLATNRRLIDRPVTIRAERTHVRPPLPSFLGHLVPQLDSASSIESIDIPMEWRTAWNEEWLLELMVLSTERDRIDFMSSLHLVSLPSDDELEREVCRTLSQILGVSSTQALELHKSLDHALRLWATSRREREVIRREDVWAALSSSPDETIGDHDIVPPAPFLPSRQQFADELSRELLVGAPKVHFLSSEPGGGKTSLISALTNRVEPIVDCRFYAFRPITPDNALLPTDTGLITTAAALWGDLLSQFRGLFQGRLAQHRVPIRNESLSANSRREAVLRLASELAAERGRATVIAVDGIDHAARAGLQAEGTFLTSLVPPEEVPDGVVFLIGGQPAAAYPNYPTWLRSNREDVKVWTLPTASEPDVATLVAHAATPIPVEQHADVARLVYAESGGNLLSAVFAVREAELAADATDLERRLNNRQLRSGVAEYYETIWRGAIAQINERVSYASERLAASIALSSGRLTGQELAACFSDLPVTAADWHDSLRSLSPLLVEEAAGFRVYHNDVRVHLTNLLVATPERTAETAGRIADRYLANPQAVEQRHSSVFDLLVRAGRARERATLYSPAWVLQGAASGRAMEELLAQGRVALEELTASLNPAWQDAHQVACGLFTLAQLRGSLSQMGVDANGTGPAAGMSPPMLPSERRPPLRKRWTVSTVRGALSDAERLAGIGEVDRARGILHRWFEGLAPRALRGTVDNTQSVTTGNEDEIAEVLRLWGAVAKRLQLAPSREGGNPQLEIERRDDAAFAGGAIAQASRSGDDRVWARTIRRLTLFYPKDVEAAATHHLTKWSWISLGITLKSCSPDQPWTPAFRAMAAGIALLLGREQLRARWVTPLLDAQRGPFVVAACASEGNLAALSWTAFVLAWTDQLRDIRGIAQEGVAAYIAGNRDQRNRRLWAHALWGAALLGRAFAIRASAGGRAVELLLRNANLPRILRGLLFPREELQGVDIHLFNDVSQSILAGMEFVATELGGETDSMVAEAYCAYARAGGVGVQSEQVWPYLLAHGYQDLLRDWAERWIDSEGEAWTLDLAARRDIVVSVARLARRAGFETLAESAEDRLSWGCIGYSSHKEYSVYRLLDWYRRLTSAAPDMWRSSGIRLLEVSAEASRTGDNRAEAEVGAVVAATVGRAGAGPLWRLHRSAESVRSMECLEFGTRGGVDGLIGMLEWGRFTQGELEAIWAAIVGQLAWQRGSDRTMLAEAATAIRETAHRCALSVDLNELSPAEAAAAANYDRYRSVSRWTEQNGEDDAIGTVLPESPQEWEQLVDTCCGALVVVSEQQGEKRWERLAGCAKKLASARPPNMGELLERMAAAVARNLGPYSWSYDGSSVTIRALFPLLEESVRWRVCCHIPSLLRFESPDLWVAAAAENLDTLCLAKAETVGADAVDRGLRSLLAMHEVWMEGLGHLPGIGRLVVPDETAEDPADWSEFAADVLLDVLDSDDALRVEAAIRGLAVLVRAVPEVANRISSRIDVLPRHAAYHLLLAAEAGAGDRGQRAAWQPVVTLLGRRPELEVALQAWVVATAYARASGDRTVDWTPRAQEHGDLLEPEVSRSSGLVVSPSREWQNLLFTSGNNAVVTFLEYFRHVTGEDVRGLEERVAQLLAGSDGLRECSPRHKSRRGGVTLSRSLAVDCMRDLIGKDLRRGRWAGVAPTKIAHALLHGDEGRLIVMSPSAAREGEWPTDEHLEALLRTDDRKALARTIHGDRDLAPGRRHRNRTRSRTTGNEQWAAAGTSQPRVAGWLSAEWR